MKVKIRNLVVDVDPESWDLNYGTGVDPTIIAEEVQNYVEGLVWGHMHDLGLLVEDA